jgi:GxxExxY protein
MLQDNESLDRITRRIIGAAIEVHKTLGPGLLESAYQACLAYELRQLGFKVAEQQPLPIGYKNANLDCGYRLDLLVEDSIIIEVKAVEQLLPIHTAQILSDLRLSGKKLGLLMNFHVRLMKDGIKRVVNELPDSAVLAFSAVSSRSIEKALWFMLDLPVLRQNKFV